MLNYYAPFLNPETQLWRFGCYQQERHWYPIGFCAESCAGHATADESRSCYHSYLRATVEFYHGYIHDHQHPCCVCGTLTQEFSATGPGGMILLFVCPSHQTVEDIEPFIQACDMFASW